MEPAACRPMEVVATEEGRGTEVEVGTEAVGTEAVGTVVVAVAVAGMGVEATEAAVATATGTAVVPMLRRWTWPPCLRSRKTSTWSTPT